METDLIIGLHYLIDCCPPNDTDIGGIGLVEGRSVLNLDSLLLVVPTGALC